MLNQLFRLSISLVFTRLVAISMPVADVILLARMRPDALPAYALGAQWAQIGVVACGSLAAAIAIAVPRCLPSRRVTWLGPALLTSALWGTLVSFLVAILAQAPIGVDNSAHATTILALGMIPLSIYSSLAAYSQSDGKSQQILVLTMVAGILNVALDIALIHMMNPVAGVASATIICWTVLCIALVFRTCKDAGRGGSITREANHRRRNKLALRSLLGVKTRALLRITLPDFFSKSGFVCAVSVGFGWLGSKLTSSEFGVLAATLNYMNIVSVVVIAITTAFGITFLGNGMRLDWRRFTVYAGGALLIVQITFLILSPITSYIYFNDAQAHILTTLNLATAMVVLDGIALFAITMLRMQDIVTAPPYFRLLMFPCAAAYIGLTHELSTRSVVMAMLYGNLAVIICLCFLCIWHRRSQVMTLAE